MSKGMTNTWVIIRIGNRKYAINSGFVKAITDMSKCKFITESYGGFAKGVYNILGINLTVLDGHKIAREESDSKTRIEYASTMNELKLNYIKWIDSIEYAIIANEPKSVDTNALSKLTEWLSLEADNSDKYLYKLQTRLSQYIVAGIATCDRILESRGNKDVTLVQSTEDLRRLRIESKKNIEDAIDTIIEYHNERVTEMCIIVSAASKEFALTIDGIELIHDTGNQANTNEQPTVLSTATIIINDKKYNVLGLTKLANLII